MIEESNHRVDPFLVHPPRLQCFLQRHRHKPGPLVRLHLPDQVQIGTDDRANHRVPAARHRVPMQHDRLQPGRHLDRTNRVATVDDIRRIGARAKRLLPWLKAQCTAAFEAIADAVGFGTHRPGPGKKTAFGRIREALVIQPRHHTQGHITAHRSAQRHRQTVARTARTAGLTDGQFIAFLQAPTVKPTECAEGVGRTTAEHPRHINTTGHREIGPRAGLGKFKA